MWGGSRVQGGPEDQERQKKGPAEAVLAGPGQEVGRAGRELGSRDPAGVSSGAWGGSGFCLRLSGCGVTSQLGYPAKDMAGGRGYEVDPGTLCSLLSPKERGIAQSDCAGSPDDQGLSERIVSYLAGMGTLGEVQ